MHKRYDNTPNELLFNHKEKLKPGHDGTYQWSQHMRGRSWQISLRSRPIWSKQQVRVSQGYRARVSKEKKQEEGWGRRRRWRGRKRRKKRRRKKKRLQFDICRKMELETLDSERLKAYILSNMWVTDCSLYILHIYIYGEWSRWGKRTTGTC